MRSSTKPNPGGLAASTSLCSLAVVLLASCGGRPPNPSPPVVVADSVAGFSGRQGEHGWSYGYWDRSADPDGVYDASTDFRLLPHFGDDRRNGLTSHAGFRTGPLWNLEDGRTFASLWARGGHPHGAMELGAYARAEQWVVRRWVSRVEGPIEIRGHAGKVMPWGENWGGSEVARIVVDGEQLYEIEFVDGGVDYSIDASVRVGSTLDLMLGPGTGIGVSEFTAVVRTR